jgi:hypothetical protein
MADTGHALQWSGYGSLASVLEFPGSVSDIGDIIRLLFSEMSLSFTRQALRSVPSAQAYVKSVPLTPPSLGSPYSPASPSETASPVVSILLLSLLSPGWP